MAGKYITKIGATLNADHTAVREIENHYHHIVVAENTEHLVQLQAQSLEIQKQAAVAQLQTGLSAAQQRDETNQSLSSISLGIEDLNSSTLGIWSALEEQTGVIGEGFKQIAEHMLAQKKLLEEISATLSQPYETRVKELIAEAERAMTQGARSAGRDQEEDYRDALELLSEVLENPIGKRNYVAWFQTGWLNWKFKSDMDKAEEAFYQSQRLSKEQPQVHAYALRHLACIQYEQGRFDDAYETIGRARSTYPDDAGILYDSARYASKTGRVDEAAEYLDDSIELRPHFSISMLSESDFMA